MCRLAAKFCSLLVNELWQEITGQWLVLKWIVSGPWSRNAPDQWIWRPSSAVVKDDGEKKVKESCITLGVATLLGYMLKLRVLSLGWTRICDLVKYATLDPKNLCLTRDSQLHMTEHSHLCSPHSFVHPSHRVWWTWPQVQKSCVSFGNHLIVNILVNGQCESWKCAHHPESSTSWRRVCAGQCFPEEGSWALQQPLFPASSQPHSHSRAEPQPAASSPLLQGLQEELWLPEAPSQTRWPSALWSQLSLLCLFLLLLLALGFLVDPLLPLPSTSWLLKCSSG